MGMEIDIEKVGLVQKLGLQVILQLITCLQFWLALAALAAVKEDDYRQVQPQGQQGIILCPALGQDCDPRILHPTRLAQP